LFAVTRHLFVVCSWFSVIVFVSGKWIFL
jgi:hypothetical protein